MGVVERDCGSMCDTQDAHARARRAHAVLQSGLLYVYIFNVTGGSLNIVTEKLMHDLYRIILTLKCGQSMTRR